MTGPPGPAVGRPEDKLHGPVTHEFLFETANAFVGARANPAHDGVLE
jgi:hypothetical protein